MIKYLLVTISLGVGIAVGALLLPVDAAAPAPFPVRLVHVEPEWAGMSADPVPEIVFKHGDISWLPKLALQAGWGVEHHRRLGQIILRESGGCPARIGGSVVDKNCKFIKMVTMSHPSDSGLLQINWVNYDVKRAPNAILCRKLKMCTQEPLLNAFNNLVAGKVLFDAAGWSPWDFCAWGEKFAKQCAATKLP